MVTLNFKKSPTGPIERTRKKPEYQKTLDRNLLKGQLGFGPIEFLMDEWRGGLMDEGKQELKRPTFKNLYSAL